MLFEGDFADKRTETDRVDEGDLTQMDDGRVIPNGVRKLLTQRGGADGDELGLDANNGRRRHRRRSRFEARLPAYLSHRGGSPRNFVRQRVVPERVTNRLHTNRCAERALSSSLVERTTVGSPYALVEPGDLISLVGGPQDG